MSDAPPGALRLVCSLEGARAPSPPFGLSAFVDDPDAAVAVLLDLDPEAAERGQVDLAAHQIPRADELPHGRRVFVLASRAKAGGVLSRLFGGRAPVPVAVRATALLARGYANLGVDAEAHVVWGEVIRPS